MARQARPRISDGLLEELLAGEDPREAFRSGEVLGALQKAIAERALGAEMAVHLGNEEEVSAGNQRNGHNRKRVLTGSGSMEVAVPRGPAGPVRAAVDREVGSASSGVRREGDFDVWGRDDDS